MNETLKHRYEARWFFSLMLPITILVVSIATWSVVTHTQTPVPPVPQPPRVEVKPAKQFYDSTIKPLVEDNQRANLAAIDRCLSRIDEFFTKYRGGIKPFSEDITSMGTRFNILLRMPADWWYENNSIQQYVQTKYEKHIFSEKQLNDDLAAALTSLRDEIHANTNQLLASIKLAVSENDFPSLVIPDYSAYDKQVQQQILEFSANRAKESVYHGIVTMITSEAAAIAATIVVEQILKEVMIGVGSAAATSAIAAGGTTVGLAVGVAGGGSVGGPVGTATGFAVGLVIGILVDWWMTEDFRVVLERDLNSYLTKLRDGIVEGVDGQPGLRESLREFVTYYNKAQDEIIRQMLLGGVR